MGWRGEGSGRGHGGDTTTESAVVRVGGLSLLSTSANVLDVLLYHVYACLTSMAESSNCSWSITCVDVLLHIGKPV